MVGPLIHPPLALVQRIEGEEEDPNQQVVGQQERAMEEVEAALQKVPFPPSVLGQVQLVSATQELVEVGVQVVAGLEMELGSSHVAFPSAFPKGAVHPRDLIDCFVARVGRQVEYVCALASGGPSLASSWRSLEVEPRHSCLEGQ